MSGEEVEVMWTSSSLFSGAGSMGKKGGGCGVGLIYGEGMEHGVRA